MSYSHDGRHIETRNLRAEAQPVPDPQHPTGDFRASSFQSRISSFCSRLAWLLTLALCTLGWVRPACATDRVWEKRFELPPGGHVRLVNVHGSVLVEGWDRAEVEATVAMRSDTPTDQLNEVQVEVEATRNGLAFHTVYPAGLDTPVRVDYRLRVPRQVRLDEVSTIEGDIVIHDVDGSIRARNLHGDIEGINVSGSVVAHTLAGNILLSLRAMPGPSLPVELGAVNGNIDLVMPPEANADLALSTVAGDILGNYAFQVSSVPGDSTRHAQVGAGGVRVALRTVRGNIRVGQRDEGL